MSAEAIHIDWHVTMLGPTRVGKTSLIAALYVAGQEFFAGKPISVTADATTKARIHANDREMQGELAQGRFSPGALRGSTDSEVNTLRVAAPQASTYELDLIIHDLPGGWMLDAKHSEEYQKALAESPCVIIPIDATVLMEIDPAHLHYTLELLRVGEVADFVREWAKTRHANGDTTRLILAPVKCESYFDDNGGLHDRAAELFGHVQWLYGDIVKTYRAEVGNSHAPVLYAPVDTIGSIYFTNADWGDELDGHWVPNENGSQMRSNFAVRENPDGTLAKRQIKGAEPILATLVTDAITATRDELDQRLAYERDQKEGIEREKQHRERNPFLHLLYIITGNKRMDQNRLADLNHEMKSLRVDLREMRDARESLSGEYNRVRDWPT
jgi:hypothetical protein